VARLAADLCGTEIALITLVDSDYQWFKARVGVEQTGTSRDLSFCGHCITHHDPLVVEDTHSDPRFADNPLVTGEPHIRFYAGVPLLVEEGSAIGALSVADRAPRSMGARQLESLQRLARQVSRELRLRRDIGRPAVPAENIALATGTKVAGRWSVVRELGRGGTGVVFEAHDEHARRVAIKVLLPAWRTSEEVVERFAREARVLMRLRTPHVGKLLDVGNLDDELGGLPYLVLEYLEGTDLDRLLESRGRVDYRDAFSWCADACDGIAEAHALGVVHRDIKPSNMFLAEEAGRPGPVVKVLDFGIAAGEPAAAGASKITSLGAVVGSPAYMAPEQMMAASDVDSRTDVWSMGAVLYELISGAHPFQGKDYLSLFASTMTKPPLPLRAHLPEGLPAEVEGVVLKCLKRPREERFQSMEALATALRASVA
jgi:serine/threonine-protein kinase